MFHDIYTVNKTTPFICIAIRSNTDTACFVSVLVVYDVDFSTITVPPGLPIFNCPALLMIVSLPRQGNDGNWYLFPVSQYRRCPRQLHISILHRILQSRTREFNCPLYILKVILPSVVVSLRISTFSAVRLLICTSGKFVCVCVVVE